jgi:hypothetical protein
MMTVHGNITRVPTRRRTRPAAANARRTDEAIAELDAGEGVEFRP